MIVELLQHYDDYVEGEYQSLPSICRDCKKAADKLKELQEFIENMTNDHYVDILEWYTNRCMELEDALEMACRERDFFVKGDFVGDTCKYCLHHKECEGKKCTDYFDGIGMSDEKGNYYNQKWTCMDFNWGDCPSLENTPCKDCIKNNFKNFKWDGIKNETNIGS